MGLLTWTAAEIEKLRLMVANGLSGSQIAHEFPGASRSSILGKCHRLGLKLLCIPGAEPLWTSTRLNQLSSLYFSSSPYSHKEMAAEMGVTVRQIQAGIGKLRKKEQPRDRKKTANMAHRVPTVAPVRAPTLVPNAKPAPTIVPPADPVGFFDLKSEHCRWPLWDHNAFPAVKDMTFCGEYHLDGSAYCGRHWRMAHGPSH